MESFVKVFTPARRVEPGHRIELPDGDSTVVEYVKHMGREDEEDDGLFISGEQPNPRVEGIVILGCRGGKEYELDAADQVDLLEPAA